MRIAIANQSSAAVNAIRRVVLSTEADSIAWIARDGEQAIRLCANDLPDLLLLDVFLPIQDGVVVTRRIMARTPCPIVIVTASVHQTAALVFEAMGAGALDATDIPIRADSVSPSLANTLAAKIETIRRLTGRSLTPVVPERNTPATLRQSANRPQLVAIGASAGGPAALATILSQWPAQFPAAVVVVQHVDAQFAAGLADWLAAQTRLRVRVAQTGDQPQPGTVLLAGTKDHLVYARPGQLAYDRRPSPESIRPSVDVFFKSLAGSWLGRLVAVLLTGMGRDGAAGLKLLREAGHHTIAQDEQSSAVYGMPRAAAELHAATEILPVDAIAPRIAMLLNQRPGI